MSNEDRIETFKVWVMANRDAGARKWAEEIEPELDRQIQQLILEARIDELGDFFDWFNLNDVSLLQVISHCEKRLAELNQLKSQGGKDNE